MAHQIEQIDGIDQTAWAGEPPWHRLGTKVPKDLTPAQIQKAAGLDWEVEMRPMFLTLNDDTHQAASGALVRLRNNRHIKKESILTEVRNWTKVPDAAESVETDEEDESKILWHPTQNKEAFEFFHDLVMKGKMHMDCAGSLFNGSVVWALARIDDSFTIGGKKDRIDSYLLFTNPHRYGQSRNIRFTSVRVVCNNTLTLSLGVKSRNFITINHRKKFNADEVKEKMGIAHKGMELYQKQAEFLASKRYTKESVADYFTQLYPAPKQKEGSKRQAKETSKGMATCMALLNSQPGAELSEGTYWSAFNAVTAYIDHVYGNSETTRLQNCWYGGADTKKEKALQLAMTEAHLCGKAS